LRLVHLSDFHLGFRDTSRTERGWNLRERDLSGAFRRALQEVARLRPDVILITGNVFDRPDPPATAWLVLRRGLNGLRVRLPTVPILIIAGERDTPVSRADPGPLAILDGLAGIEAASGAPRSVRVREAELHALLVPHRAVHRPPFPEIEPDPEARWNLLLVRGLPEPGPGGAQVVPEGWSYVAVGGPRRQVRWAPNCRAAGALERPGADPWRNATEEQGFFSFDLDSGVEEFHPIRSRPVLDMAPVRVARGDLEPGTRRLRGLLEGTPGGIDGRILRVRLGGDVLSPDEGIAPGLLSAVRARAAHVEYHLADGAPRPRPRGPGEAARPARVLEVGGGGVDPERSRFPLTGGVILLTSPSESVRTRLAEGLRVGSRTRGTERGEGEEWVRLDPPPPTREAAGILWGGHPDPAVLLRRGLEGPGGTAADPATSGPTLERGATPDEGASDASTGGGLVELEARLRGLRADAVEASGDLEAGMLGWARERQDADSKLTAYRDRARELRDRIRALEAAGPAAPCPTCGRPVGDDQPRLLETLREEWEGVIQDGRWWKRRRDQLDPKPEALRELESRVHRLHAGMEETGEALERERGRGRRGEDGSAIGPTPAGGGPGAEAGPPPWESPAAREVLRSAATLLNRFTRGRIVGIRVEEGGIRLVGEEGEAWTPGGVDLAALRIALHLGLWMHRPRAASGVPGILLWELQGAGCEALAATVLELLPSLVGPEVPILAVVPPGVLSRVPERFSLAVEVESGSGGRIRHRRIPGGAAILRIAPPG